MYFENHIDEEIELLTIDGNEIGGILKEVENDWLYVKMNHRSVWVNSDHIIVFNESRK